MKAQRAGTVLSIPVAEGAAVAAGETLAIIE
jgi:biotin carboxyl carrier protein